jgi:DNA invertase Pin-like site-specific DNA recombinase
MRVAIYDRCSTADQTVEHQLDGLRDYARARAFTVVGEYLDEGVSGARVKRPGLDRLLADARRRRFDGVLVWKLDRLGRSLRHLLTILGEFDELGVRFVSLDDAIDTSTASGRLFMQIRGAFAEWELAQIRERTEAGREAARRRGTRFGRPSSLSQQQQERVARLRRSGQSFRAIARVVGTSSSTVARVVGSSPLCQNSPRTGLESGA